MVQTQRKATFPRRPERAVLPTAAAPGVLPAQITRTVLDTHFAGGCAFLDSANAWLNQSDGAGVLHYVGVCDVQDLSGWQHDAAAQCPKHPYKTAQSALGEELRAACTSILPGIQRLLLAQGRISLTLCAGSLKAMLSEQPFQADEVRVPLDRDGPASAQRWDKWTVQLLARRCRRGSALTLQVAEDVGELDTLRMLFASHGFEWTPGTLGVDLPRTHSAVFLPRWGLPATRTPHLSPLTPPQRCAIVGAGLAGASVARALALRGWQVTVLEASHQPAAGASGLPVGLVVAHVSADDSPRSRMSRVGVRLTLQHAQALLPHGQDWNNTGVLEFSAGADRCLAASEPLVDARWMASGQARVPPHGWAEGRHDADSLWHAHAGWIKPARLISAWLAHPGITVISNSDVQRLQRAGHMWQLLDARGKTVTEAERVVVANAAGALPLLQNLEAAWALAPELLKKLEHLQSVHGTVSHGPMPCDAAIRLPPFVVNGNGSLLTNLPSAQGARWYAGATYESDPARLQDTGQQHAANWERLNTLLPAAAKALKPQFADTLPDHWSGTRCVSHDRLPLVGPAHRDAASGLWLSIAMGSRGLTFAALCAELLVARMGSEPLPIEARLARSLDFHRPRRQRTDRKTP